MTGSIERRGGIRSGLSGIVQVWMIEGGVARIQKVCALKNSSSDSVYFFIENYIIRQRMQLIVRFPNAVEPSVAFRECPVEVIRQDAFPGRSGVAAKLLHHIQLRLRDGLIVPETGFWSRWPPVAPLHISVYA
jgi:hypothetical protein